MTKTERLKNLQSQAQSPSPSKKYINTPNGYQVVDETPSRTKSRMAARTKKKTDNRVKKFFKTPKGLVVAVLLVLMALGVIHDRQINGLINAGAAFITGLVVDLIIGTIRRNKKLLPDGAMVSALIISLVLSSTAPWWQAVMVTLIALASKHILVVNRKPIFNPAAFGLLVSIYLLHSNQSWWGGLSLLPSWFLIVLLVGGFLITKKVNKFPQVFTFLGVYFILFDLIVYFHFRHVGGEVFRDPFINSTLFLAFIMLTDPPTSPAKYKDQMVFGLLAAIISVLDYTFLGGLSYLLIGLLVANAWKASKFRNPQKKKEKGTKNKVRAVEKAN
jgi:enediyne biosynthesis protein E5